SFEEAHLQDLLPKVALVERLSQNDLVEMLKFGQCELRREQLKTDRLVSDLSAQPSQGSRDDSIVIERKRGECRDAEPIRQCGVGGGANLVSRWLREGVVGDGHDPASWISIEIAERIELFEVETRDSRLLGKLSPRCLIERLI